MTAADQKRLDAGLVPVTVWLTRDEMRKVAKWPEAPLDEASLIAVVASVSVACSEETDE